MNIEVQKDRILLKIKDFHHLTRSNINALEEYVLLLLKENENYNFIGKSTIADIWDRHILDCAQLVKFIEDKNLKFADIGSGAGLPGMILSILGVKEIHLVEKSFRKCEFLRKAKILAANKVFIHNAELEKLPENTKFDVITSRALASLEALLGYSNKFLKEEGYALFLKGKKLPEEIKEAKKKWKFDFELFPSLTSNESAIIKVFNISSK